MQIFTKGLFFATFLLCLKFSHVQIPVDEAPRIISQNGNLLFQALSAKNIQFQTQGTGTILLNNLDLSGLSKEINQVKTRISQTSEFMQQCNCQALQRNMTNNSRRLRRLQNSFTVANEKIRNLEAVVNDLRQKSTIDECSNNPCHNGAVCIDGFGDYKCICKSNYQGRNCMDDVNECVQFAGTDLGCQNNARCENYLGGFRCICPAKWTGVLCNIPKSGCTSSSNAELCGHGTCIPDQSSSNPRSFKCICDHGWQLDTVTSTCTNDINECTVGRHPCSENPFVNCNNIPGGFICDQCPPGFTGNGFQCQDIDECSRRTSCGINEECINTFGSYICQCVSGMVRARNGQCQLENRCETGNGGCSENARCVNNLNNPEGRTCICNNGYIGSGIGSSGCIVADSNSTSNREYRRCVRRNLCRNGGTCQVTQTGFTCICAEGFTGDRCRTRIVNQCQNNPCVNGAQCEFISPNSYRCICRPHFTGRNCEVEHTDCGGTIIAPQNRKDIRLFISSNTTSFVRYYVFPCTWTVIVSQEQFIQVIPSIIQLRGPCTSEYVLLQEQETSDSQITDLGKYCETSPVGSFNTSGSVLIVKASLSSNFQIQHGFALDIIPRNFDINNLDCCKCMNRAHFETNSSLGLFQSENYPLRYSTNLNCFMEFNRRIGDRYKVELNIKSIDLGDVVNNCTDSDSVLITFAEKGNETITACNQIFYQNTRIVTSGFRIHFKSDSRSDINRASFKFTWRKSTSQDPCGKVIGQGLLENIVVPELSETIEAYCTWNIQHTNGSQMVNFHGVFNDWTDGDCSIYIKIRVTGRNGRKKTILYQCESQQMFTDFFDETSGDIVVIFRKILGVRSKPFSISYSYVCGESLDMDLISSYEFSSPNYPNQYDNNADCLYKIVARTRRATVEFTDFDVADDGSCTEDYIAISGAMSTFLNKRFCNGNAGYLFPIDNDPSREQLEILFKTNASITGRGFKAKVTVFDCGGNIVMKYRSMIAYPEEHLNNSLIDQTQSYSHNARCSWTIYSPPNTFIFGIFDTFHIEHHQNCAYDYLAAYYDGIQRVFCGTNVTSITTRSNKLRIDFVSDYSISGEGFVLRLFAQTSDHFQHDEIYASDGIIYGPSPGIYRRPYIYIYSITVPIGRKVLLNISIDDQSDTTSRRRCFGETRLLIKNGFLGSATIADICPRNPSTGIIQSSFNKITILYLVTYYASSPEFNFTISFTSVDEDCGSIHDDEGGEIASPNYPNFAPRHTYCLWEIRTSPGRNIGILISHIRTGSIEDTRNCNSRYPVIKLQSGNDEISIYCQNQTRIRYIFNNNVRVIFNNNYNDRYRFRLAYFSNCNIKINNTFGRIESKNALLNGGRSCSWKIYGLRGSQMEIQFDRFDLPNPRNDECAVFVKITDSKGIIMNETCGNNLQNGTFLSSNFPITIIHINNGAATDVLQNHWGIILEYHARGCVHNINHDPSQYRYHPENLRTAEIKSPNYPNTVSQTDCLWNFETISGYAIKLTFDVIDLDTFVNCTEGAILKIVEGDHVIDICDRVTGGRPYVFQSSTNKLQLFFKSANDANGGQRKFHGSYEFNGYTCSYEMNLPSGAIMSPKYPNLYDNNLQCNWNLSVSPSATIHLRFLDFDLEPERNCRYDYVLLSVGFDSWSYNSGKLCGNNVPSTRIYASIDNRMNVKFVTDWSIQNRGFKAMFSQACGGYRIASTTRQFLFSPNYPHEYSLVDNFCEWVIVANTSDPGSRIFFYFLGFEGHTENLNANCSFSPINETLTVIDGLDDNSPGVATLCSSRPYRPIVSTGHYLRIILRSVSGKAIFRAGFGTGSSTCGGEYYLDDGLILSPYYPNVVNLEMDCKYIIRGSPGSKIDLNVEEFDRHSEYVYYYYDYLEIRSGTNENSPLVGRFYTLSSIRNATANQVFNESLWLRFRSQGGSYTNSIKFSARYHINYINNFVADEGTFGSPQYGHLYNADTSMTWTINSISSSFINIKFQNFSVGRRLSDDTCVRGVLTIVDSTSKQTVLCGSSLPSEEKYASPVSLTLNANGFRYSGFLLSWTVPSNETHRRIGPCAYILTATNEPQILESPGYPGFDPNNRFCQWTIQSSPENALELNILNFSMEYHPTCKYESLTIQPEGIFVNMRYRYAYRSYIRTKTFCGTQNNSMLDFTRPYYLKRVKLTFQVDYSDFFPGFRLEYKTKCFNHRRNSLGGWIQNEEFPNAIRKKKNCTYLLELSGFRHYYLNFTSLNLPPETNGKCENGYVEVFTKVMNKKFCGNNIGRELQPLRTYSKLVLVRIVGDFQQNPSFSGFQLKYGLQEVGDCGGSYVLSTPSDFLQISNPNNNSFSPHHIECKWSISSLENTRMRIDFESFIIYGSCVNSYLTFYDGSTTAARKLNNRNYCEKSRSIFTTGNSLIVMFRNSDSYVRFSLKVLIASCGGLNYHPSGTITSPNYPSNYALRSSCVWTLKSSFLQRIRINILDLVLGNNCSDSSLVIVSTGLNVNKTEWSSCNPATYNPNIMDNEVTIIFTGSASRSSKGFKLSFSKTSIDCGGTFNDPSRELKSLNYPAPLSMYTHCFWRISSDVTKRITITIRKFEASRDCIYIRNKAWELIETICQRNVENLFIDTKESQVTISVISTGNTRLFFNYSTDQPSICGERIRPGSGENGTIIIDRNVDSKSCTKVFHNIEGPEGTIVFKLLNFTGLVCNRDYIHFLSTANSGTSSTEVIDNIQECDVSRRGTVFATPGKIVNFVYRASYYSNRTTHNVTIQYKVQRCGGVLTDPFGYITSPGYPNKYPKYSHCEWILIAPENMFIQLTIISLAIEQVVSCKFDYLRIRYGARFDSPSFRDFCGRHNVTNETITFHNNRLRMSFESDRSVEDDGFLIQYTFINTADVCSGLIFRSRGSIKSPNYPNAYPSNLRCNWTVVVPTGYHIKLTFQSPFDLEMPLNGVCFYDYLQIMDSNSSNEIAKLCGHIPPSQPIYSSQNQIGLIFVTDFNHNLDGFHVIYNTECGGIFNQSNGVVKSPSIFTTTNNNYYYQTRCVYQLPSWPNHITLLTIRYSLKGCNYNYGYLEVWKNDSFGNLVPMRRLCGDSMLHLNVFDSHSIVLKYNISAYSVSKYSFEAYYNHEENVKVYRNVKRKQLIATPHFPLPYNHNADLKWIFDAPDNYIFFVEIKHMDIEVSPVGCSYDYLAIYSSLTVNSDYLVDKLCGLNNELLSLRVNSSRMLIHFFSDNSHLLNHTGFEAAVIPSPGPVLGCGGDINVLLNTEGILASPDLDSNGKYDNDLYCVWTLTAPMGYSVSITFANGLVNLEMGYSNGCQYDYLNIYDGSNSASLVRLEVCGNSSVDPIVSTGNALLLKFVTDHSVTRTGFRITYRAVPSQSHLYLTAGSQFNWTTSIRYPEDTPYNFNSVIELVAPNNSDHILVEVTDLTLRYTPNCSNDVLIIKDTSVRFANRLMRRCQPIQYPITFISSDKTLSIYFKTGPHEITGSVVIKKYRLRYKIYECNRTETAYSGTVFNVERLKGRDYAHNQFCNVTLIAPQNDLRYQLYFKRFDLEDMRICNSDYLQIIPLGSNAGSSRSEKFCGSQLPPTYISNSSAISIIFVTDLSVTAGGFEITYVVNRNSMQRCGGTIELDSGVITSPGFGRNIFENGTCIWTIYGPSERPLTIQFTDLQLGSAVSDSQTCSSEDNYVKLTSGTRVSKFCGQSPPDYSISTANRVTIEYKSTSGGNGMGFRLTWDIEYRRRHT